MPLNKKIMSKEDWERQDRLTQATSMFAFEILQLKKEKAKISVEIRERGKELQKCCRKIAAAGGKARITNSDTTIIVKGSFDPELYNPEIGSYEMKKCKKSKPAINPELADEIDKIYKLTFGYFGSKLAQLSSQFQIICQRFWVLDQTQKGEKENASKV